MGRNTAIKQYSATPAGQPLELFESKRAQVPVIIELLKSPWLVRASDLARGDGAYASKRAEEPVAVEWDAKRQCPAAFTRTGKTSTAHKCYRIDAIIQVWATERAWWDPRSHVSRRFYRVLSRGGIYDLAYDRAAGEWRLVGIQD